METLFRFMVTRPPTATPDDLPLSLRRASKFQEQLIADAKSVRPRAAMKATAATFAASTQMVRTIAGLHYAAGFQAMRDAIAEVTTADLATRIKTWFGDDADTLNGAAEFATDDGRTADSLIAIRLLPAEQQAPVGALADVIRYVSIIRRLAENDAELAASGGLARALSRPLIFPPEMFPIPPGRRADTGGDSKPSETNLPRLQTAATELQGALDELMAVGLGDLGGDAAPPPSADGAAGELTARSRGGARSAGRSSTRVSARRPVTAGRASPAIAAPGSPLVLTSAAADGLSATTRRVLTRHGFDATTVPINRMVTSVSSELAVAARALATAGLTVPAKVGIVGLTPTPVPTMPHPTAGPTPAWGTLPTSHGTIQSVGVADLLVVKQNLKGYEAVDIAHIENVLKGESKKRTNTSSTTTEQFTMTETEVVREQERELESTDRFEMKRSTTETISEDASLTTGLTVSGSYGPSVDFETNVQGTVEQANNRSVEVASSYARDVTERSRTKLTETVRETRSLRIVNVVEEVNEHGLDNVAGGEHIVGIYQWLNKVYEAQVFNYGRRTLFDFVVPEPAAFAIYALQAGFADATQITKPLDFTITPADVSESNYPGLVRNWNATGVSPPPEPFVTASKTFRGGPDAADNPQRGMTVDAVELPLPDGYAALSADVVARWGRWDIDPDVTIKLSVGRRDHQFASGAPVSWNTGLDGEVGTIPVAVRTWRVSSFTTAVEITCRRTARALDKWRLETYAQLLQAYQQQLSIYEEKLKALKSQAGVEISGRNPAVNRETEQRELKKACISILTDQHFELFGAIDVAADGIPETMVSEIALEGPYIRFFEQAFEWRNITYIFYPYFWGRRSTWVDRFSYDDLDPLFAAFLRAGAARVVVPVRPGFETAVDHFLATGDVWAGGEPPPITSPLYVPIIEEISEQLGVPGNELPQGEPWEVQVPTSLVLVRADRSLPKWKKEDDGDWAPDES
jgi:hypothetical protein